MARFALPLLNPRLLRLVLTAALFATVGRTGLKAWRAAANPDLPGAGSYLAAAKLVAAGEPVERLYDDGWFEAHLLPFAPQLHDIWTPNPPSGLLMGLPFIGFDVPTGRTLWVLLNLALLGALALVATPWCTQSNTVADLFLMYCVGGFPVCRNVELGQAHAITALGVAATLSFADHKSWPAAGATLGITTLVKPGGLPTLVVFALRHRLKTLALWALVVVVGIAGLSPWAGVREWMAWLGAVERYTTGPWLAVTAHQSLPGLFAHLFSADARWNPHPLFEMAGLAPLLSGVALLAGLGLLIHVARSGLPMRHALAIGVLVNLLSVPVTFDYHWLSAMPVVAIALGDVQRDPRWSRRVGVGLAMALTAFDWHHRSEQLASGWLSLLAYPYVCAALLLIAVLLTSREREATPE